MATEQELTLARKILITAMPEMLNFIAALAELQLTGELAGDIPTCAASDAALDQQITKAREIGQRVRKLISEEGKGI